MSSDEDNSCPLCLDELSKADRKFRPCPCGYQICVFCFERIKEEQDKCPACRKQYDSANYTYLEDGSSEEEESEEEYDRRKDKSNKKYNNSNNSLSNSLENAKRGDKPLNTVRVIQKNLVYVTNLALSIAKPELLKKNEYFGQYGKILKIVINKNNIYNVNSPHGACVSAYITYQRKEDALIAIQTIDGATIEGRVLRASFGTTKYCSYFLRKLPCNNPDCMYLHELGQEDESYSKDDITSNTSISTSTNSTTNTYKTKPNWKDNEKIPISSSTPTTPTTSYTSNTTSNTSSSSLSHSSSSAPTLTSSSSGLNQPFKTWNITPTSPQTSLGLNPMEWPSTTDSLTMAPSSSSSPPLPLSKSQERVLPATASWGSKPKIYSSGGDYEEDPPLMKASFEIKTKKKDSLKLSQNSSPIQTITTPTTTTTTVTTTTSPTTTTTTTTTNINNTNTNT